MSLLSTLLPSQIYSIYDDSDLQLFRAEVSTSLGSLTVPSKGHLRLNGRDAITIVTEYVL